VTARALDGLRVVDLGQITAGGATSQVLGDFGAEILKIESPKAFDPFRNWTQINPGMSKQSSLNESVPFRAVGRNKWSVGLDLKHPDGRALLLALVAEADLVIENFRRGVLERLGLGFDQLVAANQNIVLVSLSSQGETGPESGYISYGSPLEAMGGQMAINGYESDEPLWTGNNINYPDQLVSVMAPGVVLAALRCQRRLGKPIHVDFSQREAVTYVVGEELVRTSTDGVVRLPDGNRDPHYNPQGVYPARGEDQWVAISVEDDEQWAVLVAELGLDASDDLAHWEARKASSDNVDKLIADATRQLDKERLAARLLSAGIAAAPVLEANEVIDHLHSTSPGWQQRVPGDAYFHRGFVAQLSETPGRIDRPAPRLAEHSELKLAEWLGLDAADIARRVASGSVFLDTAHPHIPDHS
jgi:crotonobetainyl-CoA:carnitine CoA-transferase CaiB-like acyl-CoA transferase